MSSTVLPNMQTPRSVTRFILPFGFEPYKTSGNSETFFRRVEPAGNTTGTDWPDAWLTIPQKPLPHLHSYFLREVRELVYEKAAWFVLNSKVTVYEPPGDTPGKGKFLIRPAGLVLFEKDAAFYSDASPDGNRRAGHGLLVVQTEGDPENPPDMERWLYWNENYRNFKSPHPDVGAKCAALRRFKTPEEVNREWFTLLRHPVDLGGVQYNLLPRDDTEADRLAFPFADGRAFVWSALWHGNDTLQSTISTWGNSGGPLPEKLGAWVKHLNVDSAGSSLETTSAFERSWALPLTYLRWAHNGVLYGFTPHSGTLMAKEQQPYLLNPFRESHFTILVILLYMRQRLAALGVLRSVYARDASNESTAVKAEQGFANLRRDFLVFSNLCYFTHISNQQQGQEMYSLAREALGIDKVFHELRDEIERTDAWLAERSREQQETASLRLNVLAAAGLIAGLTIATIDALGNGELSFLSAAGIGIVVGIVCMILACHLFLWPKKKLKCLLENCQD